jgi:hypothetical protein
MSKANLVGMEVAIVVSDPWEFGTVHGTGPFFATVLQIGPNEWNPRTDAILLRLESPLIYKGVTCEYFVACPRVEGGDVNALATDAEVDCALTQTPSDRAHSPTPFDLSWWRGGIGLTGTVRRKEEVSRPPVR